MNKSDRGATTRDNQVAPLPGEATPENARQKAEHFAAVERLALEAAARKMVSVGTPAKK